MDREEKEKRIHAIAKKSRKSDAGTNIIWSTHAIRELIQEEFDRTRVENALEDCTVIEN